MRTCNSCAHALTCFCRIELRRTIQSFKLLADNETEKATTGATASVSDVFDTVGRACSAYEEMQQ